MSSGSKLLNSSTIGVTSSDGLFDVVDIGSNPAGGLSELLDASLSLVLAGTANVSPGPLTSK